MFDQFKNMLQNVNLMIQSNCLSYKITKAGKNNYAVEVALASFNKNYIEVEFEDNLLIIKSKRINKLR